MRRIGWLIVTALGMQLATASSAAAWWGWIDSLSGPKFQGLQFEVRGRCFGARQTDLDRHLLTLKRLGVDIRRRIDHDRFMEIVGFTERFGRVADSLIGTYVQPDTIQTEFTARAAQVSNVFNAAAERNQGDLRTLLTAWRDEFMTIATQISAESFAPGGVRLSLCKDRQDAERRVAIIGGLRLFGNQNNKTDDDQGSQLYAGGDRLHLFTVSSAIEVRPVYELCRVRRIPVVCSDNGDYLDGSAGLGYYRVSSRGISNTLQGPVIDLALTAHLPYSEARRNRWTRFTPQFRLGRIGFANGFPANAFGSNLTGKAAEASKRPDWTWQKAIFFDLGSIAH